MPRFARWALAFLLVCVVTALTVAITLRLLAPAWTQETVREHVLTTLEREAPAAFLVTGTLDVTAETTLENTKYVLPDLLRFDLGTTRTTVRLPGRAAYGFDLKALRPEMIQVDGDGLVTVTLPALRVFSVEPDLEAMEVQTTVGWARTRRGSGREVARRAMTSVQRALRSQAEVHLQTDTQPRVHTAQALVQMLTPALHAAGMDAPRWRFELGDGLVVTPEG